MALNERSLRNLEGVHPDLVRVVKRAAELEPFIVTEGLRNLDRQKKLKAAGKSWTLNSRHLTGHAVDVVDPDARYDIPDMNDIAAAMKGAAKELGVPIVWGGDWKQRDTPHFELDRKAYPASGISTVQKVKETVSNVAKSPPAQATGGAAAGYSIPQIPAPPKPPSLSGWTEWKVFAGELGTLLAWAGANILLTIALGLFIAFLAFPSLWPKSWRPS
jgi:peptidoglycan L-alanyl-D-glutamate endopeptidase CwlK